MDRINRRIKISYLVDFFRTINAGTERQLGHLLAHLPKSGYNVQLISFQKSEFLKNDAPQLFPNISIKTLGAQSDISKSLPALFRLLKLLSDSKPDIVHTFFPASNSFGVFIARLTGINKLFSSRRDMGYNLTKKDIFLYKIANRFVSCVISNSKAVQDRTILVENVSRKKTQLIYNGADFNRFSTIQENSAPKELIVGIVANLNRPVKRVDLFIRAAAMVHKELPHVKFWIIGDGPLRNDLEQLSTKLGLDSNLVFMGRQNDVRALLNQMSVGTICSDSEGLSNSIMEYMGTGLPVVATNVGGNSEIVFHNKTGLLVPPNDENAMSKAFLEILNEPEKAFRMGLAGLEFVQKEFQIEDMIQKTKVLYESFQ